MSPGGGVRHSTGTHRTAVAAAALALAGVAAGTPAMGQGIDLGAQVSSGDDSDFGIGGRLLVDLGPLDAGLRLVGSFDLFFPDDLEIDAVGAGVDADVDYWEANVNLLYTLGLPVVPLTPYVGGGLNLAHIQVSGSPGGEFDGEDTRSGVNALIGAELDLGSVSPFGEFRYEIEGGEQWVFTVGLVFR